MPEEVFFYMTPVTEVRARVRVNYLKSNPVNDSFGAKWGLVLGFAIAALVLTPIGMVFFRLRSQGHSLDPIRFWY